MPNASRPSKKQSELLDYIRQFIQEHGYGPSYREVMRALDYKSVSTVAVHIDGLIAKGHLIKRDRSARSLEVVDDESKPTVHKTDISSTEEKWLVDQISVRFDTHEAAPTDKTRDGLYVLVGALHVLGLNEAASSFKTRLSSLAK